ncbi:hypothetical protein CC86DRAFT_36194 [Ophiobolus disseminans]|uniref:Uncharacterized protein n=1 Tax=Ophiobolus disseminans TaxID=1469910 RepID=A0A6A6ZYG2_9PLEO|nr:hypothetical protein CC86DRAFT_36194 [Ophiobolus disseminans]
MAAVLVLSECAEEDRLFLGDNYTGVKIYSACSKWKPNVVLHCSESTANATSVTLFNNLFEPVASAPVGTMPGDWYLDTWGNGLILRPSHTPRHTVIGFASQIKHGNEHLFDLGPIFDICWNPRDAVIVLRVHPWHERHYAVAQLTPMRIPGLVVYTKTRRLRRPEQHMKR